MRYEWNSILETGYPLLDNQHRQLFAALNSLTDAYTAGKGEEELKRTLEFLNSYVVKHFADEEKMMLQSRYPDYGIHRTYHMGFKTVVRDLTRQLLREGASETLVLKVGGVIADWLENHIRGDDFQFAAYLQTTDRPVPGA